MNIIIFACADFPEGPATTSRIRLMAKTMLAAGHNVSLAIFSPNAKKQLASNLYTRGSHDSIEYQYLNGRTVRPSGLVNALSDSLKGVLSSIPYFIGKKRSGLVDLVIFYTPNLLLILPCLLLAKACGIPIVLELCELNSTALGTSLKSRIKRGCAVLTDAIMPRVSSGIIAISTKIIDNLRQRGIDEQKIFHLPILVDYQTAVKPVQTEVPILSGKRYFLNSGTLEEKDGIDFVLEAFAALAEKHGDLFLAFTGDPDPSKKQHVIALAKRLGMERQVVFTGFLSFEQLIWAYHHALALLCCRSGSRYANYGFPTKLAEYLSTGRPVITNEIGDVPLYLRDLESAFMARSENVPSIVEQMEKVVSNESLASQVGVNGRKIARERFDYNAYAVSLDKFLRRISPS